MKHSNTNDMRQSLKKKEKKSNTDMRQSLLKKRKEKQHCIEALLEVICMTGNRQKRIRRENDLLAEGKCMFSFVLPSSV